MSLASDLWTSMILRTIVLISCHLSSRRLKSTIRNESWDQLLDIDDATNKCVLFQVFTNEDKRPKIHNEPWEQPLDNNCSTNNYFFVFNNCQCSKWRLEQLIDNNDSTNSLCCCKSCHCSMRRLQINGSQLVFWLTFGQQRIYKQACLFLINVIVPNGDCKSKVHNGSWE